MPAGWEKGPSATTKRKVMRGILVAVESDGACRMPWGKRARNGGSEFEPSGVL